MKRKNIPVYVLAVILAGAFMLSSVNTFAADAPTGKITINHVPKKGPVDFEHSKHSAVACDKCHHKEGNKSCFECHKEEDVKDGAPSIKTAMHNSCKKCHTAEKKGPTSCNQCHK